MAFFAISQLKQSTPQKNTHTSASPACAIAASMLASSTWRMPKASKARWSRWGAAAWSADGTPAGDSLDMVGSRTDSHKGRKGAKKQNARA
ncbi:hypothetical protein D9M69_563800 [compost metagenome]